MSGDDVVTIPSPEDPEFEIRVPSEVADLAQSLMFGDFDLEAASVAGARLTLSFATLEGMDAFIGLCLRAPPDEISERIGGSNEEERKVQAPWRYAIWPNAIFLLEQSGEPNIVWSSSVTFRRADLPEVEARVRARPVEFIVLLDEPRPGQVGTSQRWSAKSKGEALREAVAELEKGEFRRARVIRFDPASGTADEQILTADYENVVLARLRAQSCEQGPISGDLPSHQEFSRSQDGALLVEAEVSVRVVANQAAPACTSPPHHETELVAVHARVPAFKLRATCPV